MAKRRNQELPASPKILVVRLSALGDVVQTLPILPLLRKRFPSAYIGWAIDAELVPAIEGHDMLDRIHACHRKRWTRMFCNPSQWLTIGHEMQHFIDDVQSVEYDVALDVQGLFKTALLTRLSGAGRRIGFAHGREFSRFFYNEAYINKKDYYDPNIPHIEHMAALAAAVGCEKEKYLVPLPPPTEATRKTIDKLISEHFRPDDSIIAMAPGTQWESKKWPDSHWTALVRRIIACTPWKILFIGSPADASLVRKLMEDAAAPPDRIVDLSGQTSVPELYYLFSKVHTAVASDTAPLHIADAADVPHLMALFGPTSSRRTSPIVSSGIQLFTSESELACQPCHKRSCPLNTGECMQRIEPDQVFAALTKALIKTDEVSTVARQEE